MGFNRAELCPNLWPGGAGTEPPSPEGFYLVDEDNDICLRGTPLGCIYKPDLMDIFKSFPQGK